MLQQLPGSQNDVDEAEVFLRYCVVLFGNLLPTCYQQNVASSYTQP